MEASISLFFLTVAALSMLGALSAVWLSLRNAAATDDFKTIELTTHEERRKELEREKHIVLQSLRDIDFERQIGRLSPEDFEKMNAQYRARAATIFKALDDDLSEYMTKADSLLAASRTNGAQS